ncbi:MbnP family protein [Echinicola rosea]|uniref:Copper-binding protein MbnP-like domain-containing protein n=1 Tax=Echinicola rosea TaxID=1807691 RepID=A0ABQ1VBE3_9BACT|nr:MbnP family protein [Echinicola rosea]GGF45517.1 hypothetical protein GCM10011339_37500 [Echinicola rosea]
MKNTINIITALLLTIGGLASCTNDTDEALKVESQSTLSLQLDHTFGNEAFELEQAFTAENGSTIIFNELRYWISNVELIHENGTKYRVPESYYLVQHMKEQLVQDTFVLPDSVRETIILKNIPEGSYTGINFAVGIDPEYNDDLTRTAGELNALQNMAYSSWMWFTSYIFSKTKGTVGEGEEAMEFSFETGSNDCFRTVSLNLSSPITVSSDGINTLSVKNDVKVLFADIAFDDELMSGSKYVIGATTPDLMMRLSNNYQAAFSVE